MFCAGVKYHLPLKYGFRWSSWVLEKILIFEGDASIDGEYAVFLSIVIMDLDGYSPKISRLTVLYQPLGNTIVYISTNCSSGGMLTIFRGMQDPLTAQ